MRLYEFFNEETFNPPSISTGDVVLTGKFKNRKAEVTGFKHDDNNQPVLKTTKGDQKLFKPRISKLMTEDKINYRNTGPISKLTKQPLEGRAQDGGLRIGEMERDSLISHGVSGFLTESMMKRSDGSEFLFQPDTGLLDANDSYPTTKLSMPYTMRLFVQEMEAMHLQIKLSS